MNDKISPLQIIEYEKEVDAYIQSGGLKKNERKKTSINKELESAVGYIIKRAEFYSYILTKELLELQEEHISYFAELDQRLKKKERIIEKIQEKMTVDKMKLKDATASIRDVLRYTIIVDDKVYVSKVDEYLNRIEDMGYEVVRFKNAWGNEYYQGINVSFMDNEGFIFEIQFHTPNGYAIKEGKLRDVYTIIRNPNSPKDLVEKSNAIRRYYQAQVRVPDGAKDYEYQSNIKRRG